jgi:hypothetical protein
MAKNQANNIFKIKITYQLLILKLDLNLCGTVTFDIYHARLKLILKKIKDF